MFQPRSANQIITQGLRITLFSSGRPGFLRQRRGLEFNRCYLAEPLVHTFITEVSQDTWILFPWDAESQFVQPIVDIKQDNA